MAADAESLLLIQFAREPVVGAVKTRTMPTLSAAQACQLHCELTQWTAAQLVSFGRGTVELSVAGDAAHGLFSRCESMGVHRISRQRGEDLGQRMYRALSDGLREFESVILVGSDCPEIDDVYLAQAITSLQHVDVVLGPATDGGYVLIGARVICEELFLGIPWGTDQVYARTLQVLSGSNLSWTQLAQLRDIDRPEDLAVWDAIRRTAGDNKLQS